MTFPHSAEVWKIGVITGPGLSIVYLLKWDTKQKLGLHTSLVAQQADAYLRFMQYEETKSIPTPPRLDPSPLQDYPQH